MKEILITSSVLIVVLLILRAIFANKVRRTLIYGTWILVALRLLIPIQIGHLPFSVLSFFQPATETVTEVLNKPVAGKTEQDAYQQVLQEHIQDYIENAQKDQTVFAPEVQDHIQSALDQALPKEEIVGIIEKDYAQQEVYVPEVQPQVQQEVEEATNAITLGQIATAVWLVGMVVVAVWLAVGNLTIVRSLKRSAKAIAWDSPIPVYVSEKAISPCLVGLFRPRVYLTPESAGDESILRHVMTHELTHYAHRDHIWSAVRCLCLCLYWFDPLVWVAALCSRRDCELACDEGALRRLGEEQRIAYGNALLQVVRNTAVPGKLMLTATTMAETKKQLLRRVHFIAKKPRWSIIAAVCMVLVCALVAGCVAAGPEIPNSGAVLDPTVTDPTAPTDDAKPFAGKTLQIAGTVYHANNASFVDRNSLANGDYIWMMRAAIDEWAHINGVTIEYTGNYAMDRIQTQPSDIVFLSNPPQIANSPIVTFFTDEEYDTLVDILGDKRYLDILKYNDKAYGAILPWSANMLLYFNQSMFTRYNVKSPLEYFNEGAWTWDNFEKCMVEITRDLDGDGVTDIYGLPGDSWKNLIGPYKHDAATGRILNSVDDPWMQDMFRIKYNAYTVNGTSKDADNNIQTHTISPMFAMQISACEIYNPAQLFQVTPNGDKLTAVPLPRWEGMNGETEEWLQWIPCIAYIDGHCDEREASFDLLCYLIKCGMRYISDCSAGAIKCDYAGIQGTSELSQKWKNAFAAVIEDCRTDLEKAEHYDTSHMRKVAEHLIKINPWYTGTYYGSLPNPLTYAEVIKYPPEVSIPIVKQRYQAALDAYYKYNAPDVN